ncbi:hypothetical protein GQX74_009859 [Glossina fuscipes]|nr:hypothetical protein GQX74_009859 [Glossina fuscipes]
MSMRMTTLHEEPFGGHRSLAEEAEDSYSDSEYVNGYGQERAQSNNISTNNYQNRSRLTSSKTMDSFMDVSTHTNYGCLNYASTTNAAAKQLTGLATPSMSSSTSSGYGSQVMQFKILNNTNLLVVLGFFQSLLIFFFSQYFRRCLVQTYRTTIWFRCDP